MKIIDLSIVRSLIQLIPMALQTAIEEDVEFRRALPVGFHNHVGISYSEKVCMSR